MRKLGKATDARMAMLKGQVTDLLWYGRIETTLSRGKDVARMAEKLLTLAINNYTDTVEVSKNIKNDTGEIVVRNVINDGPKKLAARRRLMANLYDVQERKERGESKSKYFARIRDIKHPLIEKIFNEYAKKYDARNQETKQGGGYTRILRLGKRVGDDAEVVIVELV
ncbi:MAG: 50S ribosomal protein L17 [Clostridia bacterium]|nr:50S ribosomal protein L17 [Clostridia bacterium]